MRFAYTRRGGPLLDWSGPTPPSPTRAGETRSLGDFYATTRNSGALRRYGGRSSGHGGAAVGYQNNRALGSFGGKLCVTVNNGMSGVNLPRPGAPEVVEGYESPAPGAAIVHLGEECTWDVAHRRAHGLSGFIPEGAAIRYGQQMLGADAPASAPSKMVDTGGIIRKASVVAAAFHGVRRNRGSLFWGLVWAAAAYVTPANGAIVPAFAVAQGYGQVKQCP